MQEASTEFDPHASSCGDRASGNSGSDRFCQDLGRTIARNNFISIVVTQYHSCMPKEPSHINPQHSYLSSPPPIRNITPSIITMAPVATALKSETSDNASVGAIGRTTSGKPLKVRAYPKFDSLEEERLYRKQHLAAAYRVFAERGFDEGVAGHISVRDPILTDHFCMVHRLSPLLDVSLTCSNRA